ncbi:GPW/gp25 family protein [Paraburkholderia antibiotica]|uniref:Baseplate assembly protein n=1 Tax=Paraburkholderia antibiotica TaxID=2728839 RepID=A0A7X9X5F1_9BURK|nr:GPW/gp25 family protein [Paraburkholderia antibiotica]NML31784.1 baseplate assembly protein [Paraburkholderia antibiotica]
MIGMNASTGRTISGAAHLSQSVGIILSTPKSIRVKRRPFGSDLPSLVDAIGNRENLARIYAAVATALMTWEPRLVLESVTFDSAAMTSGEFSDGRLRVIIKGYEVTNGTRVPVRAAVAIEGSQ